MRGLLCAAVFFGFLPAFIGDSRNTLTDRARYPVSARARVLRARLN